MASGKSNLDELLSSMQPELHPQEYVFCTVSREECAKIAVSAMGEFHEKEGVTLILLRAEAERLGLKHEFPCRMITLTVHSSLEAVGFMAAVAGRLAEGGISINPVSAFYHDHLFVPAARAEEALHLLRELSRQAAAGG